MLSRSLPPSPHLLQAESLSEERDKLLDEVNELLQLQNEQNEELRALRGDAPPSTPSKGLLGHRGAASSAHLQEVYSQIDELEEELRSRAFQVEDLKRQLHELEEGQQQERISHAAELADMQRQRDDNGQEVGGGKAVRRKRGVAGRGFFAGCAPISAQLYVRRLSTRLTS